MSTERRLIRYNSCRVEERPPQPQRQVWRSLSLMERKWGFVQLARIIDPLEREAMVHKMELYHRIEKGA
jgi:hypothetical protein